MNENIKLTKIESKDKSVLQNLFQLYMHDITASLPMDVNEHGLFEYNYLDLYFLEDEDRFAYFIHIGDKLAGFVLLDDQFMVLGDNVDNKLDFSEMFILNSFKRKGYGEIIAKTIFDMHKGNWEIRPVPRNERAKNFWLKTVKHYTNGKFSENYPKPNRLVITFNNEKM